jgi:hypothetical protein
MRPGTLTPTLLIALAACAGPPPTPVDPSSVEIVGDELDARATPEGWSSPTAGTRRSTTGPAIR